MSYAKEIEAKLDLGRFMTVVPRRKKMIEEASDKKLPKNFPTNEFAKKLHPVSFNVKVVGIKKETKDTYSYRLQAIGKDYMYYFNAGTFIVLKMDINGEIIRRPYSLSSSPKNALKGEYEIAIKNGPFFSNYVLSTVNIDDILTLEEGTNEFSYSSIRDEKNVIGIAGGSGITPFISMARAIHDGIDDFNLTVLYGAKTYDDLLFKDVMDKLESDKVHFVKVLEKEDKEGYEKGFITIDLIKKYIKGKTSFFLCGPNGMYKFIENELSQLGVVRKDIRKEKNGLSINPTLENKTFKVKVHVRDEVKVIEAKSNETLLVALERGGVNAPSRCRSGLCGFCHTFLMSGKYYVAKEDEERREADFKFNYIHPCVTFPLSDLEIDIPFIK